MKFGDYIRTTCRESSIHGLPYLVKRELHWLERVVWGLIIVASAFLSLSICLNQWKRFRDNPIVYGLELANYKMDYPFVGITVCPKDYDVDKAISLAHGLWGEHNAKLDYYLKFVSVVNGLRFDTLHTLMPYANDAALKNVSFIDVLLKVSGQDFELNTPTRWVTTNNVDMAASISEAGLCQTSSQLSQYTNPFGELKHLPVWPIRNCNIFNECTQSVLPNGIGSTNWLMYFHNVHDVITLNDDHTSWRDSKINMSIQITADLVWTSAEERVRDLPIAYRKCRYSDESNLKYYETYTASICRLECRIEAALKLCNCKPYFYATAPKAPSCNIDGLLCLAAKNWYNTSCNCLPLCDEMKYHISMTTYVAASSEPADTGSGFSQAVNVAINTPYMAKKRRVVFSADQLLVSFGGAVSLFLGMSFVSLFGLIYVFLQYIIANVKACLRRRKNRVSISTT